MLLFLSALAVQAMLPRTVLLRISPRPVVTPLPASRVAMPADPIPNAYRHGIRSPDRTISVAALPSSGNVHPNARPLASILSTLFPLAELPCVPGVYIIRNQQTGAVYIGESRHILQQLQSHRSMLAQGIHPNAPLQADFHAHGLANFEVSILAQGAEYANPMMRRAREKAIIAQLAPDQRYNILDRRGERNSFFGKSHTPELRQRLSDERKGVPNTALGRPISIPPFRTRKGTAHEGGVFTSVAEASRVTGVARRDIRRRLNDPLLPDWKEIHPDDDSHQQ